MDDDPEIRALIAAILAQSGTEIQGVGSVGEAIGVLRVFAPDLLITDYGLPDANGCILVEKAKRVFPKIKCLMITGWRELPGDFARQNPPDVIMNKPFSVVTLEIETRRLLSTAPGEPAFKPSAESEPH